MSLGLILTAGSARGNVDLAVRAEAAGFDSVFSVEFFNQHGFVVLGAIAQVTERIRLGSGIANAFTRSPTLHGSAALDLDELSEGRMILGLGSGTRRMNEQWYAVPFSRPAARMEELVGLLRQLFASTGGGGFRFDGAFWSLHIPIYGRANAARPTIPLWVAGVNKGMMAAAGACADALVGHPVATRRWHRECTLPTLRDAEKRAGRESGSCRLVPYVLTSIQPDAEQARRDAKQQIGFYYTTALYHSILRHHDLEPVGTACRKALATFDFAAMAEAIPDSLVDEIAITGTPAEARDQLAQWEDLTDEPLLYAPTVGVPPERQQRNLDAMLECFGSR